MAGVGFQFSPGAFRTKDADPEGTLEMFEKYCESMTRAFRLKRTGLQKHVNLPNPQVLRF